VSRKIVRVKNSIVRNLEGKEKKQRENKYLTSLHEITIQLLNCVELEDLLNTLIIGACRLFGTLDGYISLCNEQHGVVESKIGIGRYANVSGQKYKIDQGFIGQILKKGHPIVVEDYKKSPDYHEETLWNSVHTRVGMPLKSGDKAIGIIVLDYFDLPRSFSQEEAVFLSRFADLASIAFGKVCLHNSLAESEKELQQKNAELTAAHEELIASEEELRQQFDELSINEEEMRRQNIILTLLHETTINLMNRVGIDNVLQMIMISASNLLGTGHGWIYVLDEQKQVFVEKVGLGMFAQDVNRHTKVSDGLVGQGYKTGKIIIVDDYNTWENRIEDPLFEKIGSVVQVPLKIKNKVIGVLSLAFQKSSRKISHQEISLLTHFAELAAIALDNAELIASYKQEILQHRQTVEVLRASEKKYKNLYQEFQQKQALLVSLINSIPDLIFYKDKNSVYLGCNHAFEGFAGLKAEKLIGLTDLDMFDQEMAKSFRMIDREVMQQGQVRINEQLVHYPDGRQVLFETLKTPYYDPQGNVLGIIGTGRDITERKKKEADILFLSYNDVLTTLYNRTYFAEAMKQLEAVCDKSIGLVMCDVDGLKIINDTLGHDTGDIILKAVAEILKTSFGDDELVARIGGDEFAVLLYHDAEQVAEDGCRAIKRQIERYNLENPNVPISLSMGVAIKREASVDINVLFKEADNNMYREKLHHHQSSRSAIVQALTKALEVRDFQTEGHGERMQDIVEHLAVALGLPEKSIADLRLLARFHDIGKVGIPDAILFKPGKLTEEEHVVMRQHSEIGYRIALSAPDLALISDWILKHHEYWDGTGYPLGIKGDEIPLECRIVAIADAYDAMTSDRPYRKAMGQSEAVSELIQCAGTQFDPSLVKIFIELIDDNSNIRHLKENK